MQRLIRILIIIGRNSKACMYIDW